MTLNDITIAVYKQRLEEACPGDVQRMIEQDADNGEKLALRAMSYRPIVSAVLRVLSRG